MVQLRAQGDSRRYSVVLSVEGGQYNYERFFTVAKEEFVDVSLPLDEFEAYYRGKKVPDAPPLNAASVISFGFRVAGGVYLPERQSGPSSLEINTVTAIAGNTTTEATAERT